MAGKFPAQIPTTELLELVAIIRGTQPGGTPAAIDTGLYCAGCLHANFAMSGPIVIPFTVGASAPMNDLMAADEIERLVGVSKTVSAPAPGALPSWMAALFPLLMSLLQAWLAKKSPSIVPVP